MKRRSHGFIKSVAYAASGLKTVWGEERSFKIQVAAAVLIVAAIFLFGFTYLESVVLIISATLVLAVEAINTAVERMMDKMEPNHDPLTGKIKDIMAAAVLIT